MTGENEIGGPEQADIDHFTGVLRSELRQGHSLDDLAARHIRYTRPELVPALEAAIAVLNAERDRIGRLRDPRTLQDGGIEPWYTGPANDDVNWPAYSNLLQNKLPEAIPPIDDATSKTLTLMPPPVAADFHSRGLVLGYVQSGKTANYIGLIAKAADVGYRFIIVMTGMLEPLRKQTLRRIETDLLNLNSERWISLTTTSQDFRESMNVNAFLSEHSGLWTIAVVKKNARVLEKLAAWLEGARDEIIRNCPVLIIDDEADQASINTARGDLRTAINDRIIRINHSIPKVSYVGYTASPFANLLVDPNIPDDLYPQDFIVDLPRPHAYFGPERIFGREELGEMDDDTDVDGIDCIRIVPDDEAEDLKPPRQNVEDFVPDLTPSLEEACGYFVLAAATRHARGQTERHISMLVHTTTRVAVHNNMKIPVEAWFSRLEERLRRDRNSALAELREIWESEAERVDPVSDLESPVSFDTLIDFLPDVLDKLKVIVENGPSPERLDYEEEPGQIVVVIGGDILSRGLTIEGLTVSYFLRAAGAYDTLLQMGRWFGYRPGYSDLCRMWLTRDLSDYFRDVALVEREIRHDVERYELENLTPQEFQVRIRRHPALNITAPGKMQAAIHVQRSYSGRRVQTIMFHHRDPDWLGANLAATHGLIGSIPDGAGPENVAYGRIFQDVPAELILQFLDTYRIHEDSREMRPELLAGYINSQVAATGELEHWNVVVMSRARADADLGAVDLGLDEPVARINRSRFVPSLGLDEGTANIKALMSVADIVADYPELRGDISGGHAELIRARTEHAPGRGALLLYPISQDSRPQREQPAGRPATRVNLDAVDTVIGVAFVFPSSTHEATSDYVSAPPVVTEDELLEVAEDEEI